MSKTYAVKELFLTLQGEGAQAGRPAVFCRFSGCNLWSGLERDRTTAVCTFCDTDFVGTDGQNGGRYGDAELAAKAAGLWQAPRKQGQRMLLVCTGGEPLLQLDEPLIDAFHQAGFDIAVETNGTIAAPPGLDWICVSPKSTAELVQTWGHELKLVFHQADAPPEKFAQLAFEHFFLQPMDGPDVAVHTQAAVDYCLAHPQWRLSVQTHKVIGID